MSTGRPVTSPGLWFTFPGPLAQAGIGLSRWDGIAMNGSVCITHGIRLVQFLCDFATTWQSYASPGHRPGFRGRNESIKAPTGRRYRSGIIDFRSLVMAAPLGLSYSGFNFPGPLAQADIGLSRWDGNTIIGSLCIAHGIHPVQFVCDFATTWQSYASPGHRPGFQAPFTALQA